MEEGFDFSAVSLLLGELAISSLDLSENNLINDSFDKLGSRRRRDGPSQPYYFFPFLPCLFTQVFYHV